MDSNHPWRETRLPALLAGEEKPNVDDVAPLLPEILVAQQRVQRLAELLRMAAGYPDEK